jgi:hypothetical protein
MYIIFSKDVTVDVFYPQDDNDVYERFFRKGSSVKAASIEQVSKDFSTVWLMSGEVLVDTPTNCFKVIQ